MGALSSPQTRERSFPRATRKASSEAPSVRGIVRTGSSQPSGDHCSDETENAGSALCSSEGPENPNCFLLLLLALLGGKQKDITPTGIKSVTTFFFPQEFYRFRPYI